MRRVLFWVGVALWAITATMILTRCTPADIPDHARRATNALTVEQYRKALDECVAEGKDAGSMAVYSRCAGEADKHYGAKP